MGSTCITKILSTISSPVGMNHLALGNALSAEANVADVMDRLLNNVNKQGGSSGGIMSKKEQQLFIDNDNALIHATNNQIVGGMALDFALKIEPNVLKVEQYGCMIKIGIIMEILFQIKQCLQEKQPHYLMVQQLQELAQNIHVEIIYIPKNITTSVPPNESASDSVGTTNYYAKNDHSHPLNITTSISLQDSVGGSVGFVIVLTSEANYTTRGLRISPDGNTLTFNGRKV
ncbi:MAG: hypothetical protein EZS28_000507 [Streblomastix strix]|uniref:Uncharacterized protein n=1 Tax=Streblomastix strix TaxID=222440 RepID=A0A5J4X9I5_9EUKA|nr:MAG: hypothetical protein EZS28_000507 [Streblomastix strix]